VYLEGAESEVGVGVKAKELWAVLVWNLLDGLHEQAVPIVGPISTMFQKFSFRTKNWTS